MEKTLLKCSQERVKIEATSTDVVQVDLAQVERQTIAFLYELWRLQGITNKKIVTKRER